MILKKSKCTKLLYEILLRENDVKHVTSQEKWKEILDNSTLNWEEIYQLTKCTVDNKLKNFFTE